LAEADWESHRPAVFGAAYRMLGSETETETETETEDVTQEVWLRAAAADLSEVRDLRAWLVTLAARTSYNVLKLARVRRKPYVGVGGSEEQADPIFTLHAEMERLTEACGLPRTVLRSDTLASNTLGRAEQIRTAGVVRGPLTAATAVVDPRDIAAVAARALTDGAHAGATHRLTGARVISRPEQVRAIGAAIGRELRFEEVPLVTSTVADLTGRPPRSFPQWARDHSGSFRRPGLDPRITRSELDTRGPRAIRRSIDRR
jgi:uncharacterized protein YbjT (DUF2867 family)